MPEMLVVGTVWPEPQSSAAGSRMMQLLRLFREADWEITFASPSAPNDHSADLASLGIDRHSIRINDSGFDRFVANLGPDLVMFDRFMTEEQFGWRVAEASPGALRLLDTEDLHALRKARRKALSEGRPFSKREMLSEEVALREVAAIYRSDLTLMISEFEMELLTGLFGVGGELLHYLPFMTERLPTEKSTQWRPYQERDGFMTIGNFRHPPNWDSVCYLREEVWPLIREQLPNANLRIYGAYPTQQARALHSPGEGFHIEGRAADADAVFESARICLAPLRFGAGLKGKLVQAMQNGTPCVTTPVGAEGIPGKFPWPGGLGETPEELAAAAVGLYRNRESWIRAQQQGMTLVNERFSGPGHGDGLLAAVRRLRETLKEHRRDNFTGAMLRHHRHASTRYMAKWIEAKNRGTEP